MVFKRATGWIGIDVGGACVKTAQAVRRGGSFFVGSAAIVPRRQRWTADSLAAPEPQSSVDEMLAAASICDRLAGRAAAAVLPMALCEAIQVETPTTHRRSEVDLAALVEAETHHSLADRVVGTWPATMQPGRTNVMTAPVAWSDQVSADVAAARWNCRAVDSLPWALARAAAMAAAPEALPLSVVLDWGYARSTLCLVHQGAPAAVRCLKDCGYAGVVASAQRTLRVDEQDAELLLQRHGLSDPGDASRHSTTAVDDALADSVHALERELRRTLGYWQSQTRGVRPERLYLFGAGASLAGIERWLSTALDLDVRRWLLPADRPDGAQLLPPCHLLGPALAASALAWEGLWPAA